MSLKLSKEQAANIRSKLSSDPVFLKKIYHSKKDKYMNLSLEHSMADSYIAKGWEVVKQLNTKTRLRKLKDHSKQFEDDIWCQFYELGFRTLNIDEHLLVPFDDTSGSIHQLDVVAINEDVIFVVQCKSSITRKSVSYKNEFDLVRLRKDGIKHALQQALNTDVVVRFIWATRNIIIDADGEDSRRADDIDLFLYNDNTYKYIQELIAKYKKAAIYQVLGLFLKGKTINKEKIEIPAIRGTMGQKTYYMFSLEPSWILKLGFILHRTRVNDFETPTYQRLLIPSRLKGITNFINNNGFFPNSIIINFNTDKRHKLLFEPASKMDYSRSCYGTLIIPNAYAIAYIIDGQHRVYGYAASDHKDSNTIPIVAFDNLPTEEQLQMFMDINENQKAVSPSLRLDLEQDLYWESNRADSRIKALRSGIVKLLANNTTSPLYGKIAVGEDLALLTFKPFSEALSDSGLLPKAKGNQYDESSVFSFYDIKNADINSEMSACQRKVYQYVSSCYKFVMDYYPDIFNRDKYFIVSNRGTYAFICLIGSLHTYMLQRRDIDCDMPLIQQYDALTKYLTALLDYINDIPEDEEKEELSMLGQGADIKWLRYFQSIINKSFPEYNPQELIMWQEEHDEELQSKGRTMGVDVEKQIKHIVIETLQTLYGDSWELEINAIKRECANRAEEEMEKNYKEGLGNVKVHWTEMFNINDYKSIIEKYWSKKPDGEGAFVTFEKHFSIDIGEGFNSKSEKLKWLSVFNTYRNLWAHEGTKEKRLNKKQVDFIQKVYDHFYSNKNVS